MLMNDRELLIHFRILSACAVLFVAGAIVFGIQMNRKMDRMTAVAESLNTKVNDAVTAAAPLGHAAVDKGVQTMNNIDEKDLAKSATEGTKELGRAATRRVSEWLDKQQ
jgi:hypothetical protein